MADARIYEEGDLVEAWHEGRREWIPGDVLGVEEHDGRRRYLVQLRGGYPPVQATDPNSWRTAEQLRPAL